jgi:hypothetical protein
MRKHVSGEEALIQELLKYKLINRPELTLSMQQQKYGVKRSLKDMNKKERKKTVRSNSSSSSYHNAHLSKGGDMERIVNEAAAYAAANNTHNE